MTFHGPIVCPFACEPRWNAKNKVGQLSSVLLSQSTKHTRGLRQHQLQHGLAQCLPTVCNHGISTSVASWGSLKYRAANPATPPVVNLLVHCGQVKMDIIQPQNPLSVTMNVQKYIIIMYIYIYNLYMLYSFICVSC